MTTNVRRKNKGMHRLLVLLFVLVLAVAGVVVAFAAFSGGGYDDAESFDSYAKDYFKNQGDTKEVGQAKQEIKYGDALSTGIEYPDMDNETMNESIKKDISEMKSSFEKKYAYAVDNNKDETKAALLVDYQSYKTPKEAVSVVVKEEQQEEKDKEMTTPLSTVYTYNFSTTTGNVLAAEQIFNNGFREKISKYVSNYLNDEYKDDLLANYKDAISADNTDNFSKFAVTNDGVNLYFDTDTVLPKQYGVVTVNVPYDSVTGLLRDEISERYVDAKKPMVALTFDDGPAAGSSDKILDCLEKNNAVATFFELGQNVEYVKGASDILKRELELGCEVGSHSYSHPNLFTLSDSAVKKEFSKTNEAIKKAIGQEPTVFRPPYGNGNEKTVKLVGKPGILWSVDTLDWQSRNAASVEKVVKGYDDLDGKVILMHSIYDSSAQAAEDLVPWLQEHGYQMVTVSELLKYKYHQDPGKAKFYGYNYFYKENSDAQNNDSDNTSSTLN